MGQLMIRAIFWDNDGVLVDTEGLFFAANREILAEQGIEIDRDDFADVSLRQGRSILELIEGIDRTEFEALRLRRNQLYEVALRGGVRVFEGVEACLDRLHGQLPMAVVTSSSPEHFKIIHEQTDLMQYFEFVLMGGDYDRHKPHPDPYLAAAERIGVAPADCLVVEDSERGLQSATRAGMRCIMIPNPLAGDADLSLAHAVVGSVSEIPEIVTGLM